MMFGDGWTYTKGSGSQIATTDGSCGATCYRTAYGVCAGGSVKSGNVPVTFNRMVEFGTGERADHFDHHLHGI